MGQEMGLAGDSEMLHYHAREEKGLFCEQEPEADAAEAGRPELYRSGSTPVEPALAEESPSGIFWMVSSWGSDKKEVFKTNVIFGK
jgi:hypothetical protein